MANEAGTSREQDNQMFESSQLSLRGDTIFKLLYTRVLSHSKLELLWAGNPITVQRQKKIHNRNSPNIFFLMETKTPMKKS